MNDPEGGVIPTSGTQGGKTPQSGTHGSKGDIAWAAFALLLALLLSRIDEKVDQEYIVTLMAIYHRLQYHSAISLLYLLLFSIIMSSVISNNVQVNVRGPDDLATLASYVVQIDTNQSSTETDNSCTFDDMIIFSHPLSFHEDDSKYALSHLQQIAYEMTIDRINSAYRCGVVIKDKRYGLTLVTYGDNSSKETVAHIAKSLTDTNSTGFLLGPYSSGLTKAMSPIVNDAKRILVAAGSSQTPVFEGNDYVFGTLLRSEQKLEAAIEALVGLGAKTIAVVHEDGSECAVRLRRQLS